MKPNFGAIALVFSSIVGVFLALGPSIQVPERSDDSFLVRVNGHPIEEDDYQRALVAIANDKRNALTPEDEERVLSRLIEQELLVQRGIEIGLVDQDLRVRNAIVTSVIDHILKPSQSDPLDEEALREWYEENQKFFRSQSQLHLKHITEDDVFAVPNALLPLSTLSNYLGPSALEVALVTPIGEIFEDPSGNRFKVMDRRDGGIPAFDANRADIEIAYRRSKGDEAFRAYLDWLQSRAEISR
ncbi:MAG: hypothetical protein AAGI14_13485 [Pseudomonadota bacterium]